MIMKLKIIWMKYLVIGVVFSFLLISCVRECLDEEIKGGSVNQSTCDVERDE